MNAQCSVEGCDKPVEKAGMCATHRKRKQRGQELEAPVRRYGMKAEARLLNAAIRLADADSEPSGDKEYKRASALLRKYAQGYGGRSRLTTVVRQTVAALVSHMKTQNTGESFTAEKLSPAPLTLKASNEAQRLGESDTHNEDAEEADSPSAAVR